jgi:flagellar motor protein MotB
MRCLDQLTKTALAATTLGVRAQAVVAASRRTTPEAGAQRPPDGNHSADGRDHNRRVEFLLADGRGAP